MMSLTSFEKAIRARAAKHGSDSAYEPEINDLYFLYQLVREKAVVSILEYGSGWSTLALAMALLENFIDFGSEHLETIRHPNPFTLLSLDASKDWQKLAVSRLTEEELAVVRTKIVTPVLTKSDGALCHTSDHIPNFVPDLIYLDGPDHTQVTGDISGFKYEGFTLPMSADLLSIEPYLWPETIIVSDGRTANVRFLESRFKRNWQVLHDPFGDRSILRINEPAFGVVSEEHIRFRLNKSRIIQKKEPFLQ